MHKVRIIVDSSADLAECVRERVTVVPLHVSFGESDYLDGVTLTHRAFYEKLVECDTLPTTSQPSPVVFEDLYRQAKEKGEEVVVITVSSKLSGTYQSAIIAADGFSDCVWVVDSRNVALGSGILAEYALQLVDRGMTGAEVAAQLCEARERVCLIGMLDTLEYLKRGGRISKTVAFAGGILSIKPVIHIRDGEIHMLGKARGSRQGNNFLVSEIQATGGVDFSKPVLLGYTGLSDALLQKYIEDSTALWQEHTDALRITVVGSVVGTHAGPGAIAAAFFHL